MLVFVFSLWMQFPKFEFYDPKTPIYTSPRFLPPTKMDNCRVCLPFCLSFNFASSLVGLTATYHICLGCIDQGCHHLTWMFLTRMYSCALYCGRTITFGLWCWAQGRFIWIRSLSECWILNCQGNFCWVYMLCILSEQWLLSLCQDTLMMGADSYQTESEIASLLAEGKVPIGIGRNTKIRY